VCSRSSKVCGFCLWQRGLELSLCRLKSLHPQEKMGGGREFFPFCFKYKFSAVVSCMGLRDGLELGAGTTFTLADFLFAGFLLYGGGAAADAVNLKKFYFYGILGGLSLIGLFVRVYLDNEGVLDREELQGFRNITLHSPEDTLIGREFPNFTKPQVLISFFFALAMLSGGLSTVSGQLATGTPELVTGSVSPGTSLGLAVSPAVWAETLMFNVVSLFGTAAVLTYLLMKAGVSYSYAWITGKAISVLTTSVFFMVYHSFTYSGEANLISIFVLGLITNTFTAATHSAIPGYLVHGAQNFFSKASSAGIFSTEFSVVIVAVLFVVSALIFMVILGRKIEVLEA